LILKPLRLQGPLFVKPFILYCATTPRIWHRLLHEIGHPVGVPVGLGQGFALHLQPKGKFIFPAPVFFEGR
jgi:hypothetical protein